MTALFTTAAFLIALVSVGLTEVIKKNLPEATPNWALTILNIVIVAASTVVYALTTPDIEAVSAVITGIGAFAIAQVEYNYLFKLFTSVIEKLKTEKLPSPEVNEDVVDAVSKKLSD